MNNCVLIGRLTRAPEMRVLQSGTATTRFTLAVDRALSKDKKQEAEAKGQPTADFIPVTVWGKQAESCANYLAKGRMVAVSGRITTGSYEKDGKTVYTTEVLAQNVEFLEFGEKKQGGNPKKYTQQDMKAMFGDACSDPFPF